MAQGTSPLGWLVALVACLALVVSGCGGGSSSSAPATGDSTTAQAGNGTATTESGSDTGSSGESAAPAEEGKPSGEAEGGAGAKEGGSKGTGKKHPPIEVPSGEPESAPTEEQQKGGSEIKIEVALPAGLTNTNSCRGKDESPAITWGKLPPGTKEVAIFAAGAEPTGNELEYIWAMAGIDPSLGGLKAGEVPAGAVLGRNSSGKNGYSLCIKGSESYAFTVFAVESEVSPKEGFDPATLRGEVPSLSAQAGLAFVTYIG
jgi:phosphatidylethanolamine-binding protein (PEBP) family uncharacterized protein